jgi:hypothetical protein
MIRKQAEGIEYLQFELFAEFPELVHAVFLKQGDESPPVSTLLDVLNIPHSVSGFQRHTKEVKKIDSLEHPDICDGMVTDKRGLALLLSHADCQIAIFYDPVHHAIANVHSGWRGNVQNIYREAVVSMKRNFGSRPEELFVGISPSLGPDHAEFKNYKTEFPPHFWNYQVRPNYFNLWEIARFQLEAEGILPHHIQIANLCTYTETADFFSYRRDKTTKRNCALAAVQSLGKKL